MIKKKYFDVKLDVLGSTIQVLGTNQDAFKDRVVKFDLTKVLKGKNCEAKFLIKVKDNELLGEMFSFEIYPSFIKKMIGRNISIIEDSFSAKCTDVSLRVKPFLITRKRVHRTVRKELRENLKQFVESIFLEKSKAQIFEATVNGTLQRIISKRLKKIYPLAVCELRVVKIEK